MSCIANDVVDWKHPANAKKSRDSRYLKKILTNAEIEFVHAAENPDVMLWSLWACKETAFKVISKSDSDAPFLPRQWSVQLNQPDNMSRKSEVIIPGGNNVFVQICFAESYVHCIGSDNLPDLDKIIWGVEFLPQTEAGEIVEPSSFVRKCLCRRLANIYNLNFLKMEVRRTKKGRELQPPHLYYENNKAAFDISLSHDGQFVAYAFIQKPFDINDISEKV
ncbi:MAG: 4'-phosphopantetheinyl transferase superfamily protein [Smithellaceae bacterium]